MSCLCIGGVCIPYSALFPMLLLGLRWIASQFARFGLLPDFIAKRLGLNSVGKAVAPASCDAGCCDADDAGSKKKKSAAAADGRSNSVATTTASSSDDDDDKNANADLVVEHIDNLERWKEIFTATKQQSTAAVLFVKFTADWCKPCEAIHPAYVSLASKYTNNNAKTAKATFVTVDVDRTECDILTGKLKVAMMPTFVCFKGGVECGRMTGGNDEEKLNDWVEEMMK